LDSLKSGSGKAVPAISHTLDNLVIAKILQNSKKSKYSKMKIRKKKKLKVYKEGHRRFLEFIKMHEVCI
jgi:ribosomal protein L21